jgi:hypothetical protein
MNFNAYKKQNEMYNGIRSAKEISKSIGNDVKLPDITRDINQFLPPSLGHT